MPEYLLKALFVVTGLLLAWQLYGLLGAAKWWLPRCLVHCLMGLAVLLTANAVGQLAGLGVGLNGLTVPLSAALGAPGVGLLWAVKYLL